MKNWHTITTPPPAFPGATWMVLAAMICLLGCAEGTENPMDQEGDHHDVADITGNGTSLDGADGSLDVPDVPNEDADPGDNWDSSAQQDMADISDMPGGDVSGGSDLTADGDGADDTDLAADATDVDMGNPCDPMNCDPMACASGCAPQPCNDTELLGGCYTISQEVFTGSTNFYPTDLAVTGTGLHLLGKSGSTLANYTRAWVDSQWTMETFGSSTTSVSSTGYVLDLQGNPHILLKKKPQFGATSYSVGSTYLCDGDWARHAITVAAAFGPADGEPRSVGTIDGSVEQIQLCMPSSSPIRKMSVADFGGFDAHVALRFDANDNPEVLRMLDFPPRLVRYKQGLDSWTEETLYAVPNPTSSTRARSLRILNDGPDTHVFAEFSEYRSHKSDSQIQVVYLRVHDGGTVETLIVSPWTDENGNWRDTYGDDIVDAALSPSGVPYMAMRHGYQADRDVQLFKVENGVVEGAPLIDPYPDVTGHNNDAKIAFHPDGSLYHLTYDEPNNLTIIRKYEVAP